MTHLCTGTRKLPGYSHPLFAQIPHPRKRALGGKLPTNPELIQAFSLSNASDLFVLTFPQLSVVGGCCLYKAFSTGLSVNLSSHAPFVIKILLLAVEDIDLEGELAAQGYGWI